MLLDQYAASVRLLLPVYQPAGDGGCATRTGVFAEDGIQNKGVGGSKSLSAFFSLA